MNQSINVEILIVLSKPTLIVKRQFRV